MTHLIAAETGFLDISKMLVRDSSFLVRTAITQLCRDIHVPRENFTQKEKLQLFEDLIKFGFLEFFIQSVLPQMAEEDFEYFSAETEKKYKKFYPSVPRNKLVYTTHLLYLKEMYPFRFEVITAKPKEIDLFAEFGGI